MKTKTLLYVLPALLLASCAADEPWQSDGADGAAVVSADIAGIVKSRASGTQWSLDDKIGITGTSGSVAYCNVPYTTDGSGRFEAFFGTGKGIFFQDNRTALFSAYYPYNKEVTAENRLITASTGEQFDAPEFDFLFASGATGSQDKPELNFTGTAAFKHSMAQLIVNITASSDWGFESTDVLNAGICNLSGIIQDGEFDTASGQAKATGTPDNVALHPGLTEINDRTATYKLIFFPQTAGDVELSIEFEGDNYVCTFTPKLEAGKSYTANFTLKRSGLILGQVSIGDWIEGEYGTISGTAHPDKPENIDINGHEAVLMRASVGKYGDPDYVPALYFATTNIGAETPSETGLYFQWGMTKGYPLGADDFPYNQYGLPSYGDLETLIANGYIDANHNLVPQHDAASQHWGGLWRMPTLEDMEWVERYCVIIPYYDSVPGFLIRSSDTGGEIFLPTVGMCDGGVVLRNQFASWTATALDH